MSKQYIDINRLAISMVVMLICSLLLSSVGLSSFVQTGSVERLSWLDSFVSSHGLEHWYSAIFLTVEIALVSMMISNNFTNAWLKLSPIIYILAVAISASDIMILPGIAMLVFPLTLHRGIRKPFVILRYLEVNALIILYQAVSLKIKTNFVSVGPDLGIIGSALFYVDYTIFLVVFCMVYKYGGLGYEQKYKEESQRSGGYLLILALWKEVRRGRNFRGNQGKDEKHPDRERRNFKNLAKYYGSQLLQILIITVGVYLQSRVLVFAAMFLLGYMPQKLSPKTGEPYHADKFIHCTFISFVVFYCLSSSSPPTYISVIACVPIGAGAAAMMDWVRRKATMAIALEELSPDDILFLIDKAGLEGRDKDMAVMWWIKGMTNREVATSMDRAESTVKGERRTIRERLEDARN